tara:strand:- start:2403 stop:3359 length:957 start_codon:yes stop_codon:yes gene_type:complete
MDNNNYLDFEQPIELIEKKIKELSLKDINSSNNERIKEDLEIKKRDLYKKIYKDLTPWQKVQIARHPNRPHTINYITELFSDFIQLAGDKKFSDDPAILGGIARLNEKSVIVLGTEKGDSMDSRIEHNFGMAKPEGYRKAQRLFEIGNKFNLPIIVFIDTAGAFPGKDAEERGQAEAIASSIAKSLRIHSPIISLIIGEGGSGGAIALATADRVLMLENSIYSVISPEGCASILWRDTNFVKEAAESLKLTAKNCLEFGVIDEIIPELPGGAHRNYSDTLKTVKKSILKNLNELLDKNKENLILERNEKFLNITSKLS